MAGHSQFKNIMHRKGAQDKKRAKVFTRIMREIIVAAKSGQPDPNTNAKLRTAINAAKAINMSKDKIDGAIAKATSVGNTENYESVRYEGYGPNGVAIIVEALTDNRNRTASEVRASFTKHGGNLGEQGSVSFMFDRVGLISYPAAKATEEDMFETSVEAGASDCKSDATNHEIFCDSEKLNEVKEALVKKFGEPETAKFSWRPRITTEVNAETLEKIINLTDALEEYDDVQEVFANFEASEETLKKLAGS